MAYTAGYTEYTGVARGWAVDMKMIMIYQKMMDE